MADTNSLNTTTVNGKTYVAGTAPTSTSTSTSAAAGGKLDKEAFLQLLCTQLQHQDPLDPQDNSQYIAQLAQFSSLEQMTNVSNSMGTLSSLVSNIDTSMLVGQLSGMIGQKVQWSTTTNVTDAQGNIVKDASGNAQTTTKSYEGTVTGVSISDGAPSIIAKDSAGNVYKVVVSDLTRVGSSGIDKSSTSSDTAGSSDMTGKSA
jgi:flagellar basal-body rod modification protein FlgD